MAANFVRRSILVVTCSLLIQLVDGATALTISRLQHGTWGRINASGTHVLFVTPRSLVTEDGDFTPDLYVSDLATGQLVLVSAPPYGIQTGAFAAALSDDGAVVAYLGRSKKARMRLILWASGAWEQLRFRGSTDRFALSADGARVFFTAAESLRPRDTNEAADIYSYNSRTAKTHLVSYNYAGGGANSDSYLVDVSSDGRTVLFDSYAGDLVARPRSDCLRVWLRNLRTRKTTQLSGGYHRGIDLSNNGRAAAYVNEDVGQTLKVRYLNTGKRINVTLPSDPFGGYAYGWLESGPNVLSHDGGLVMFSSPWGDNLIGPTDDPDVESVDPGPAWDIFIRDLGTGEIRLVTPPITDATGPCPEVANSRCEDVWAPSMSADGRLVVFSSAAPNFITGVAGANVYLSTI
jgi:Tol biopolymer transport system component